MNIKCKPGTTEIRRLVELGKIIDDIVKNPDDYTDEEQNRVKMELIAMKSGNWKAEDWA